MPRTPATPEQKALIRKRIRDAAAKICRKGNYEEVSARAIATEAGVSVGTIYSYYENLSDLIQSLWMEPVEKLRGQLNTIAEETPDPVDRIRALMEAYAKFAHDKHAVYRGAFLFVRPEAMKKPEKVHRKENPFYQLLSKAIADGQKTGQIRQRDPDELVQTLWAGLHGALGLPINIDRIEFESPQRLAQYMIDTLIETISVPKTKRSR